MPTECFKNSRRRIAKKGRNTKTKVKNGKKLTRELILEIDG